MRWLRHRRHFLWTISTQKPGKRRSPTFLASDSTARVFQATAGITIILALGGYLVAVTQGAAILLSELTDLGYVQGLIVAWLSYTIFTMYSGSRGVILTDTANVPPVHIRQFRPPSCTWSVTLVAGRR